ncbi:MFS transporter [Streptomyces sp. NPDC002952]|uniref:MFS transporter n=1 Tax=Streptomyces sp. NPDC002952 TaxID=3364673 RepID=UPI00367F574B
MLLVVWVRGRVPHFPGEAAGARTPPREVAALPGVGAVLSVTLLLLPGHQVYRCTGPFARHTGFGSTELVLMVFGVSTPAGVWPAGSLADRWLRRTLLTALAVIALAVPVPGSSVGGPAVLLGAVTLWGAAFGGAPTPIQTALVDASGPEHPDVATSLQTTVCNAGIAAGSFAGGLVLEGLGAAFPPWTSLPLVAAAPAVVALGRGRAFPGGGPLEASHRGAGSGGIVAAV